MLYINGVLAFWKCTTTSIISHRQWSGEAADIYFVHLLYPPSCIFENLLEQLPT